jgi:hypothetical protein
MYSAKATRINIPNAIANLFSQVRWAEGQFESMQAKLGGVF